MKRAIKRIYSTFTFIGRFGIICFMQELYYRLFNYCCEHRLGVDTSESVKLSDLGIHKQDSINYVPMGYKAIYSAFSKLPLNKSEGIFLDYGAGKGRVIIAAATFPYKKVIGVEIAGPLIEHARANVENMRHRKAKSIDLIQVDATEFILPKDVNVLYFFNPFIGNDLEKVVANIYSSFKKYPRKINIIFFNNGCFENIIHHQRWLVKIFQAPFYPGYSCGIYETVVA